MNPLLARIFRKMPDELYLRLLYFKGHRRFLSLKRPRRFDEKLQWYKLHYRDPLMTTLSDKYAVRQHLAARGYGRLLNELYGVYDRVEDIDWPALPRRFVLKATHGSGMNILCRDKEALDREKCYARMRRWLQRNYFDSGRQWAYKNIPPRLICERYLENEEFGQLFDYKFYCFNGKPEVVFACTGRYGRGGVRYNTYDMGWTQIPVYKGVREFGTVKEKPGNFDEMVAIACDLSRGFPFIRVDLYFVEGRTIFGELTFYPDSGMIAFWPSRYDFFFGDLFVLLEPGGTGSGK